MGDSGEITTNNEGAVLGVCLAPGSIFIDLSVTSSKLALDALQERADKLETRLTALETAFQNLNAPNTGNEENTNV